MSRQSPLPAATLAFACLLLASGCSQFGTLDTGSSFGGGGNGYDDSTGGDDGVTDYSSFVGEVEVDGASCPVDEGSLKGYCLQAESTFAVGGSSSDCPGLEAVTATAWLSGDALDVEGDFTLDFEDNLYDSGEGSVWVSVGKTADEDQDDDYSYASASGTASLARVASDLVEVSFEAELVTFIGKDPGPTASGTVYCTLGD